MIYKRKISDLELKDFDQKQGIVTFYFAHFGNKDSDNDIIQEGAYTKTLNENRKRIKHFKNHDLTQVPGVIMDLQQDQRGAYAVSQLAKTTLGRDTLIEYESGIITEHSQGFNIVKEDFSQMDGANIIKEIRLWEVSSLTAWGANELTPMVDLKHANDIIQMMQRINSLLTKTAISDERAKEFEREYTKLSKLYKSLTETNDQSAEVTEEVVPEQSIEEKNAEMLQLFINKLKF